MYTLRTLFIFILCVPVVLLTVPKSIVANESDDLAKVINQEVRQAERLMFSGKNEEADQLLDQVAEKLTALGKADPTNRSLKSAQSKFDRIRKQVDKKLGKVSGTNGANHAKSAQAVPAKPAPKAAPKTATSTSNRHQQQMQERALKKVVKDVDYELGRAMECLEPEGNVAMVRSADQKAQEAMDYLQKAKKHLEKFTAKYPDLSQDATLLAANNSIQSKQAEVESWKSAQLKVEATAAKEAANNAAAAAQATAVLEADAQLMLSLYKTYYPKFENIHGGSAVYGMDTKQIEQALNMLQSAETSVPAFAEQLGRLADTYGHTAMDIQNTMAAKGYRLEHSEETRFVELLQGVENVKKTRIASAATLVDYASSLLGAFSQQLTDHRIKRMGEAKQLLLAGQRFDAGNTQIQQMLATIDDQMAQVADKMAAKIDATQWKENIKDFPGPGSAKSLAADAKKYFINDRDWGKKPGKEVEILRVSVQGPWKVAETDPFGRIIQWRLPIHVAVTDKDLKARKLARVYDLSIVAQQGGPGQAPKKPPFDGYWVGESWMMRLSKF